MSERRHANTKLYKCVIQTQRESKQEAQLLLGDRATRKHAKDCRDGRGNDNLG